MRPSSWWPQRPWRPPSSSRRCWTASSRSTRPRSWRSLYPVLDLVLLAGLVRLLVGMGRLRLSMTLLTTSFTVYLVADVLYNASVIYGFDDATRALTEAFYLAALVLLAGAATAPDVAELALPRSADSLVRPKSLRLVALTIGVLTAPALLFALSWSEGQTLARMLASATIVVILLALWRIRELLSTVDDQAVQLGQQARTDSLTGLPNRRTLDYELDAGGAGGGSGWHSPDGRHARPRPLQGLQRRARASGGRRAAHRLRPRVAGGGARPVVPGPLRRGGVRPPAARDGRRSGRAAPGAAASGDPRSRDGVDRLLRADRRCHRGRECPPCGPGAVRGQGALVATASSALDRPRSSAA